MSAFVLPLDRLLLLLQLLLLDTFEKWLQLLLLLRALFCMQRNCRDCLFGFETVLSCCCCTRRSQFALSLSLNSIWRSRNIFIFFLCCALYACRTQNAERQRRRQRLLYPRRAGGGRQPAPIAAHEEPKRHKSTFGSSFGLFQSRVRLVSAREARRNWHRSGSWQWQRQRSTAVRLGMDGALGLDSTCSFGV